MNKIVNWWFADNRILLFPNGMLILMAWLLIPIPNDTLLCKLYYFVFAAMSLFTVISSFLRQWKEEENDSV